MLELFVTAGLYVGPVPSARDVAVFKSWTLHELALLDHARGWAQQFHLGALRNANSRALREIGTDAGFDSIGDFAIASDLARFLDRLDQTGSLASTILYSVNPAHNEVLATMAGNFCRGEKPGQIQFGRCGGSWTRKTACGGSSRPWPI